MGDALLEAAPVIVFVVAILAVLAAFGFWIWTIVHAIKNKQLDYTQRIIWVLAIVFFPLIGSILYLFLKPKGS